ncbi:hypothetical protein LCGC14_2652380, partial [marine sediment metagenome]
TDMLFHVNNTLAATLAPGGNLTLVGSLTATAIRVSSDNAGSIGVSGTAFSDLFLASGAVINFNAGNMTITHSAGTLAIEGGKVVVGVAGATQGTLVIGGTGVTNSIAFIGASIGAGSNAVNLGDDGTDAVIGVGNSSTDLHILKRVAGVYSIAMTISSAGNFDFKTGTTAFNTITYTWPGSDGGSGNVLSTNGSGILSWTAGGAGALGGSGTAGTIAKWSAAATLTDSVISESAGGDVTIGTPVITAFTPSLSVVGTDPAFILKDTATAVDYFAMNVASGIVNIWYDDAADIIWQTATTVTGAGLVERMRLSSAGVLTLSGTMSALDMAGQIDLNTNNIIAGGTASLAAITDLVSVIRSSAVATLILSGGSNVNAGGNITLYGETHANNSNFLFRAGNTDRFKWDEGDVEFTVFGQMKMDDGGLPTDVAGVVISGSDPVAEDYVDGTIWC